MLSQIQFHMLHCDVFQQHPLVGIEQIETGNRFQVVEPVAVDGLRGVAGVEHAGRISRRTPLLHVLIGIDGKDNQPGTAGGTLSRHTGEVLRSSHVILYAAAVLAVGRVEEQQGIA